jgi:hypothetical protein
LGGLVEVDRPTAARAADAERSGGAMQDGSTASVTVGFGLSAGYGLTVSISRGTVGCE